MNELQKKLIEVSEALADEVIYPCIVATKQEESCYRKVSDTQSSIHDYDTSKMCDICRSYWHVMMARFYVADALRVRRRD